MVGKDLRTKLLWRCDNIGTDTIFKERQVSRDAASDQEEDSKTEKLEGNPKPCG